MLVDPMEKVRNRNRGIEQRSLISTSGGTLDAGRRTGSSSGGNVLDCKYPVVHLGTVLSVYQYNYPLLPSHSVTTKGGTVPDPCPIHSTQASSYGRDMHGPYVCELPHATRETLE